ncbi:HK97 family phage prohead protease [Gordonia alkanivorans]|uniref:HK97 family phage prohead protease n=1 Tax=Gordonia alkanivorans TaxID=84096 RepID=UPI0024484F39|nr:HK97 family phage prohead protease [Gordonia alkanivorans]MDH3026410.1 HK97 family phage prohead protease [Gordonia alkanivorans]
MNRKTLKVEGIKTAGLVEGTFEGFASCFDNVDSVGDVVRRGAFAKALKSGRVTPLIWEHRSEDPRAYVGEVVEARETDEGLAIKGRFDLDTEHGAAAYRQVKGRRVEGLSIGYIVRRSQKSADGHTELLDLDLLEVSVVARGANDRALVGAVKSVGTPTVAARSTLALTRHRILKSALTEGTPMPNTARLERLIKGRDEQLALADSIIAGAEELKRDLTADEAADVETATEKAAGLDAQIKAAKADDDVMAEAMALAKSIGRPMRSTDDDPKPTTGHLPLTGRSVKALARSIARASIDPRSKALVANGSRTTAIELRDEIAEQGRPPQSILDVLPSRVVGATYSYLRQTVRTNNAAPVATGGTKPTSTLTVESVDGKLTVIAHVSEQIDHYTLADNANLEGFVESEMLFGLRAALEDQIINGSGTAPNLRGLLNTSGIQTQSFSSSALTSIRKGITKLESLGYTPSVLAVSADDWEAIELLTASSGATDVRGVPVDAVTRRLWGVQAVVSTVLPAKTAILLDGSAVSIDLDGQVDTRWSDSVGDDFTKNFVRARVESRFGLSVFKPNAVVSIATAAA